MKSVHLGTWTLYADIAGQVSKSPQNPVVTSAAVAIAPEIESAVRRQVLQRFHGEPKKWKHGKLDGLARVVALVAKYHLPAAVVHVHRTSERWMRFYDQAQVFNRQALEKVGRSLSFLDGEEVMRLQLMAHALAHLVGCVLRQRYVQGAGPATTDLEWVIDSDLKTEETRELYRYSLRQWVHTTELPDVLDIHPTFRGRVATEQEEPLLLIPDYFAGVFQHADDRAVLAAPVVSQTEAARAIEDLRHQLTSRLHEKAVDFDEEYPLDHDEHGRLIERRES